MPLVGEYKTPETIHNKLGDWLGECPDGHAIAHLRAKTT